MLCVSTTPLLLHDNAPAHKALVEKAALRDTLNTFYLWLYGVRHMVKDQSYSEKGNPLSPLPLLFLITNKESMDPP